MRVSGPLRQVQTPIPILTTAFAAPAAAHRTHAHNTNQHTRTRVSAAGRPPTPTGLCRKGAEAFLKYTGEENRALRPSPRRGRRTDLQEPRGVSDGCGAYLGQRRNVCFTPKSGSRETPVALPLCAIGGSRDADKGAVYSIISGHSTCRKIQRARCSCGTAVRYQDHRLTFLSVIRTLTVWPGTRRRSGLGKTSSYCTLPDSGSAR